MERTLIAKLSLTLALVTQAVHADPRALQVYAQERGIEAPQSLLLAIDTAAKSFGVDPRLMVAVGIVESRLNPKAVHMNKDGSRDIGALQINTNVMLNDCIEYNIYNVLGNALCAAKLIKHHSQFAASDIYWLGRYNSRTPSKKMAYVRKLAAIEQRVSQ